MKRLGRVDPQPALLLPHMLLHLTLSIKSAHAGHMPLWCSGVSLEAATAVVYSPAWCSSHCRVVLEAIGAAGVSQVRASLKVGDDGCVAAQVGNCCLARNLDCKSKHNKNHEEQSCVPCGSTAAAEHK